MNRRAVAIAVLLITGSMVSMVGLRSRAAASAAEASREDPDPHAVVRGMTISCHGSGQVWGSDAMISTMAELKELGVNWVTIHPYAGIRADGSVPMSDRMYKDTTWLTRPIQEAHRLGLKIMIKPHIAYWASPFSWRGEIDFDTDEEWERFFTQYAHWITTVAEICSDADAFVVGTELDRTTGHEEEWRRIIAAIREKTDAPLTYAANWDTFQRIGFWDALDVIGIQSYFPLVNHDRIPEQAELDAAWAKLLDRLHKFAEEQNRKIILAELGYNRAVNTAREPWKGRYSGGDDGLLVQTRCLRAAMKAVRTSDIVTGAFLWKWFPGNRSSRDFRMSDPAVQAVIREEWGQESKSSD